MQESGEGCLIGFEIGRRVGAHDVQQLAVGVLLAWVGLGVGLNPLGDVVVLAVLPCAEPEEDEAEVVLAGLSDEQVHIGEVECALGGLHLLPVDGGLDGIGVHGFGGAPGGGKGRGPGAGVVDLAAEQKERLAIDNQGEAVVSLLKMGNLVGLGFCLGVERGECKGKQNKLFHGTSISS